MGAVGSRMQVELLNRQRWKTRIELATAISDYIWRGPVGVVSQAAGIDWSS
jgi:hypothetical protein